METSEFCRFCGLTLRCTHTASVEPDTLRAAFAVPPSPPDLMLRCVCAHALPEPDGAPLAVQGALRTYRRGTHITLLRGAGCRAAAVCADTVRPDAAVHRNDDRDGQRLVVGNGCTLLLAHAGTAAASAPVFLRSAARVGDRIRRRGCTLFRAERHGQEHTGGALGAAPRRAHSQRRQGRRARAAGRRAGLRRAVCRNERHLRAVFLAAAGGRAAAAEPGQHGHAPVRRAGGRRRCCRTCF